MAQDVLTVAWKFMRRRKFATAIKLLEGRGDTYEGNFEYYVMLGTACLYVGDIGSSVMYYQQARKIKLTDTRLLLGQAAIFLRRGDVDRALQYYLEVKSMEPANKIAIDAIEFIRKRGDYDTICRWVDTGRIEQFYPSLGTNPDKIAAIVIPAVCFVLGIAVVFAIFPKRNNYKGERRDLTELSLSSEEIDNSQEKDLSTQAYSYILNDKQITQSYTNAINYFQAHRDNAAQVEINRLLNSNASISIKKKAQVLMSYLEEPDFNTIKDSPDYKTVESDPVLYLDAWVVWSGRITNAVVNADNSYTCQLLVGYESGDVVDGIVTVKFKSVPNIAADQPLKILGQIKTEDSKIYLQEKFVYQSVKNGLK